MELNAARKDRQYNQERIEKHFGDGRCDGHAFFARIAGIISVGAGNQAAKIKITAAPNKICAYMPIV